MVEALLLSITRVTTIANRKVISSATGFFFERNAQLFLVTNRHVVLDEASDHRPDALEIELHIDPENVAETTGFGIPLYEAGLAVWREAADDAGSIDVVAIELDRAALPPTLLHRAFTPAHLVKQLDYVEAGTPILIAGFPLGFHDTLHHLPVMRQAVIASSFGIRFQGNGYFLTDARMHRGTSGAPVAVRVPAPGGREDLNCMLLGIHAGRMDVANRDVEQDERLELNFAWYADVLLTLTEPREKSS